jgi:hypothetical protein
MTNFSRRLTRIRRILKNPLKLFVISDPRFIRVNSRLIVFLKGKREKEYGTWFAGDS